MICVLLKITKSGKNEAPFKNLVDEAFVHLMRTPREDKSQMSDSGEFPREILSVERVCGRLAFPQISSLPTFCVL